ncbi:F0F1 ATP synthase subunit B family protein [Mycoplasma struthionis]|uniref:ATP synthase subunit b n=1 Tax=Mycoplasma struthionis TaxID=538220 RepID=A0A3G8LII2_9MOLU|nr:ATP synthase F0 subunit B [Mycoplasma struthionis]AZG68690.1 hypothetical protein EGN60_01770 [Mycoplasma struthionis]
MQYAINLEEVSQAKPTISDELGKAFDGLTFSWPFFVFSLLTLVLLTLIITFLVYKPIKKMLKNRQKFIQDNIDESIKVKEEALKAREENDKKILDAASQAATIINKARVESERIIQSGADAAKKKADMILETATVLTNKKAAEFEKNQKKIIMENAIDIAKKIIGREIKDKDNLKLIKQVLEEQE